MFLLCLIAGCTSAPPASSVNSPNASAAPPDTGTVVTETMANTSALPALIQELKKSVVAVTYSGTHEPDEWNETDFEFIGSGVIYSVGNGKAYALTNRHVVDYNYPDLSGKVDSENITIATSSGQQFLATERLVAPGLLDLAILVFDTGNQSLSSVPLSSTLPQEGDDVLIIGMPEELNWSISKGIVSGIRTFTPLELDMGSNYSAIQTDAAINPGNSGGGMFSTDGRLLGINAWKYTYDVGLNFAVSVVDFPGLKGRFVPFPLASPDNQVPQGGAPIAITDVTMGDYNESSDSFSISFAAMDANWFPTSYVGPLTITLQDDNGTTMLNYSSVADVADFHETPGYPFYGLESYSVDIPMSSVTKSYADYANLTVEATPATLSNVQEIFVPDFLSPDYSGSGAYYNGAGGAQAPGLKGISGSSSNRGVTVNLTAAAMSKDDYGTPYYAVYVTIANGNREKADLYVYDATLVVDGKQYPVDSGDTGDIGYLYPGAYVYQELDFTDVPSSLGASATLYLTLYSYPSEESSQYHELDYRLGFRP